MRSTLDIDDDVLAVAKELATMRKTSAGKVLSDLARRGLRSAEEHAETRNRVPILPPRPGARPMTMDEVNRLRDEAG